MQANSPQAESPEFLGRVESLRGVAAMMVAIAHSFIVLSVGEFRDIWQYSILQVHGVQAGVTRLLLVAFNGNVAVTIFFVISGFVLGLSLDRRDRRFGVRCASFVAARVFRLYPALLICIGIIAAYWLTVRTPIVFPQTSEWYRWYRPGISFEVWWKDALLLACTLNPIAWTLQVEMAAAFVLPVLHLASRKRNRVVDCCAVLLLLGLGATFQEDLIAPQLFVFYIGLMVPTAGKRLAENMSDRKLFAVLVYLSVAMILLPLSLTGQPSIANRFIEACGAFIFISAMTYGPDVRLFVPLDHHLARFYGRISYSFYLYHFFLMYALSQFLLPALPGRILAAYPLPVGAGLALLSVALTTVVAALSYRYIERPGIALGGNLTRAGVKVL